MFTMNVPLVKKAVYGWFLIHGMPIVGKRLLDFGPGDGPWPDYMASLGAEVDSFDRSAGPVGGRRVETIEPNTYDIIIASAAIQHNREGAEDIYKTLAAALKPDGRIWLAEQMANEAFWWADRQDPCWVRSFLDHEHLWRGAGLLPEHTAYLHYAYDADPDKGYVKWCGVESASVVVAMLRRQV